MGGSTTPLPTRGDRPMDPQHLIYDEITRLQQRLLEGLDAIPKPATLVVGPHPTPPTASLRPVPSGHYPRRSFRSSARAPPRPGVAGGAALTPEAALSGTVCPATRGR